MKWHELGGLVTAFVVTGGTGVALLKGFFQTKKGCVVIHKEFKGEFTKQLNEIEGKIDSMEEKRQDARFEISEKLQDISQHMGAVKQYMENHK